MSHRTEIRNLYQETIRILNSDDSWEDKYDQIFSQRISRRVRELINLDYCDPDTSYEEDVTAFVSAFKQYMEDEN